MPYASRICSIFPLWMESKALVKSTKINVACRFFARTPSRILRMVNICEVVDLFLRKPFWFFLSMVSIWVLCGFVVGHCRFYKQNTKTKHENIFRRTRKARQLEEKYIWKKRIKNTGERRKTKKLPRLDQMTKTKQVFLKQRKKSLPTSEVTPTPGCKGDKKILEPNMGTERS